ncbi:helix-turn-helix transcriptional regulator [Bacteroidota bacterium]
MDNQRFSKEELDRLNETAAILEKYKFSDVFGDIAGALQKVIDFIDISSRSSETNTYTYIHPEKVPHIKGSEYLAAIIKAISQKQTLRLYYQPFYEDKPYFTDIHPYLLKEYKYRWYLVAMNDFKKEFRTYALDRIRDIQEVETPYEEMNISAGQYFKHSIGVISPPGEPPKIRIAVQKTQAQYMITQPWHDSQNIEEETEDEIVFSFKVHPTYEFITLLLSYGKDLRVLQPDSLKKTLKEELKMMLTYY